MLEYSGTNQRMWHTISNGSSCGESHKVLKRIPKTEKAERDCYNNG